MVKDFSRTQTLSLNFKVKVATHIHTPIMISPSPDKEPYLNDRGGPYAFASETSVFCDSVTHSDGSVTGVQVTIDLSGFGSFMSNNNITFIVYVTSSLKPRGRVVLDSKFVPGADANVYYSDPRDAQDIASFILKNFQRSPRL